jgi:RNA-directed DNA polymerase
LAGALLNYSDFTPKELAEYLGTKYSLIKYFYYQKDISSYYREFKIPKKSGGHRIIRAPSAQLAHLQTKISELLSRVYTPRVVVTAFRAGHSIKDNAARHVRKSFVFNLDLKDFFSSITFHRVRGLLQAKPYSFSYETATVIAHLTTYDGVLPQGAPSSPIISNMICSKMDGEILRLSKSCRATYTRYADDLTFSFLGPAECVSEKIVKLNKECWHFSHSAIEVGNELSEIIENNGFLINKDKTRLQAKNRKQVVTGLTVNKKVNVDRRFIRKTAAIIHSIEAHGREAAQDIYVREGFDEETSVSAHLRGRLLFIYQIKGGLDPVYRRLAARFNALPISEKVPLPRRGTGSPRIARTMFSRCWVLEESEKVCAQATGFLISKTLILTCAHFFTKEGDFTDFEAFRSGGHRYQARLVTKCDSRDLAIAVFQGDSPKVDAFLPLDEVKECSAHEQVTIWGYPNHKIGSEFISCVYARVTQKGVVSSVPYAEVDKPILGGNSGGPVLNGDHELVGVAHHGADTAEHHNAFLTAGAVRSFWDEFKRDHADLLDD